MPLPGERERLQVRPRRMRATLNTFFGLPEDWIEAG
jgi:hypothetical protein